VTILKKKYATQAEIDAIGTKIDAEIDACVRFAEESPFPDDSELFKHIYVEDDYPFLVE
jgi:pyruvate dehydrogenase E1 component alpha subunit